MAWTCDECGSTNVEAKVWYNFETQQFDNNDINANEGDDDTFCVECQDNCPISWADPVHIEEASPKPGKEFKTVFLGDTDELYNFTPRNQI